MPNLFRSHFTTVKTEGALLPADLLARLVTARGRDRETLGLTEADYHLAPNERLNEAINRAWNRCLGAWQSFDDARHSLPTGDAGTTLTRERWLLILFQELGYGRLQITRAISLDGASYPISHLWASAPIHLVSFRQDLDRRGEYAGGITRSPHSLVQEFLNRSPEHLWGIVANGLRLRLLRDNASLTRAAYVEFDLEAMLSGQVYADFSLLWLLCHESRLEGEPSACWLERWSQTAADQGIRALEDLRRGVREAITAFGQGFLALRENAALKARLASGELSLEDYYHQLLRLVYRLIFLFVAEDRELLLVPGTEPAVKERYQSYYSVHRLREMSLRLRGGPHPDLYRGLRRLFSLLRDGYPPLGLPALGSFLFSARATPDLDTADLANADLLPAVRTLAFTRERGTRWAVDYRNLGTEELGSVYESLLQLHPGLEAGTFDLIETPGSEQKTTGSYYTPPSLVQSLLDSALEPVIAEALKQPDPQAALLDLKACDPACGSGHFLVAAAHRLARRLARLRTGDEEPSPEAIRPALRQVISHCIYGVDLNEMAVELCKVSLWMESLEPGKPLSFLDQHIQHGNSLIGATPRLIRDGIPDAVFEAIEGDDKKVCAEYKKRNKEQRQGRWRLLQDEGSLAQPWERLGDFAANMAVLETMDDSTIDGVRKKESRYAALVHSSDYRYGRLLADAWCAAFVWKKTRDFPYPITEQILRQIESNPFNVARWMVEEIRRLAGQYGFFHWHLAFPEVFRAPGASEEPDNEAAGWSGGFDAVLGNPPWERIKLQEKEWFAAHGRPDIANAPNAADRARRIEKLKEEDPTLYNAFLEDRRQAEGESQFVRQSGLYPLTGRGDVNTYAIFAETNRRLVAEEGRVGCIIPSGIATDDTTKFFFRNLMDSRTLVSLYDFENREGLFPAVDSRMKFCLLTLTGPDRPAQRGAEFAFFALNTRDLEDRQKRFTLSAADLALLNPNTRTCPIFRSRRDAELTKAIYRRVPVFESGEPGAWPIKLTTAFHSLNDADKFEEHQQLELEGWVLMEQGWFRLGTEVALPLYEGKMFSLYDHRAGTVYLSGAATVRQRQTRDTTLAEHQDPGFHVSPFFWVREKHFAKVPRWDSVIAFKKVTSPTNERTLITSLLPACATNDSIHLLVERDGQVNGIDWCCLLASISSFACDYLGRQKLGGVNFNFFVFEQLPVLPPSTYADPCPWQRGSILQTWILPRVLELTYTAWDLQPFARDCGYDGPPFRWDEDRRFLLRCELDAAYFHLYGIARDAVDYIMETFPIVKRKDEAAHGEYRTKRVILEMYEDMGRAMQGGAGYRTRLEPAPADERVAHETVSLKS